MWSLQMQIEAWTSGQVLRFPGPAEEFEANLLKKKYTHKIHAQPKNKLQWHFHIKQPHTSQHHLPHHAYTTQHTSPPNCHPCIRYKKKKGSSNGDLERQSMDLELRRQSSLRGSSEASFDSAMEKASMLSMAEDDEEVRRCLA
jgi:hypothetical protein